MNLASATVILAMTTVTTSAPLAGDWKPDVGLVERIEKQVVLPPNAHILSSYKRSYAGETVNGRRVVEGVFEWSRRPGLKIVPRGRLPQVDKGGCNIVDVTYDVETAKVSRIACHPWG